MPKIGDPHSSAAGISFETHPFQGPFVNDDGNLYVICEATLANGNRIACFKSGDGGATWTEQDTTNRPPVGQTGDTECGWVAQNTSDYLHVIWMDSGGDVKHARFNTSTAPLAADSWGIDENNLFVGVDGVQQVTSCNVLSDGRLRAFWCDVTSGAGYATWDFSWDTDSNISGATQDAITSVTGASDVTYIFYRDGSGNCVFRTLSSTGTLSSPTTLVASANLHSVLVPFSNAVYYDDAGVEVITIVWANASGHLRTARLRDGVVQSTETVNSVAVLTNPGAGNEEAVVRLAVDGKKVYAVWAQASDSDVYFQVSDDEGAWSSPVELADGVTTYWINGANVLDHGTGKKLAFVIDNNVDANELTHDLEYWELSLGSPQNVAVGQVVETGEARALAAVTEYDSELDEARPITVETAGGPTNVPVGQVTETDEARAVTSSKQRALGQVSETGEARAVTVSRRYVLGQVTETDTAGAVTATKRATTGQVSETDTARAVTSAKHVTVGQVSEADTAQAVTVARRYALGQVAETDTARSVASTKRTTLGQVVETDEARAVTATRTYAVGRVDETDLAQAVTSAKRLAVGQVGETDAAGQMSPVRAYTAGQVGETDAAQAVSASRSQTIGQVEELDTAGQVTSSKQVPVGQVTELDTATTVVTPKFVPVGQVVETDTATAVTAVDPMWVYPGRVDEVDEARAVTTSKTQAVGQVVETDLAGTITPQRAYAVTRVEEVDEAQPVGTAISYVVGQVEETDEARVLAVLRSATVGQAVETDLARSLGRSKSKTIGRAGAGPDIQVRGSASASGTSVVLPAGIKAGDLILVGVAGKALALTFPAGYTALGTPNVQAASTANQMYVHTVWKVADGSEGGTTWTVTGQSGASVVSALVLYSVNQGTLSIQGSAQIATGSNRTTATFPTFATTVDGEVAVYWGGSWNNTGSASALGLSGGTIVQQPNATQARGVHAHDPEPVPGTTNAYVVSTGGQASGIGGWVAAAMQTGGATDLAQPITSRKTLAIGQVVETDEARQVGVTRPVAVGRASETDEARQLGRTKTLTVGQVLETDTAGALASAKTLTVGQVEETDLAQSVTAQRQITVGQVIETDTAGLLASSKQRELGQTAEIDAAQPLSFAGQKYVPAETVTEVDEAGAVTPTVTRRYVPVVRAEETDLAQAVTTSRAVTLGQAIETDLAGAVTSSKALEVGAAVETDEARPISVTGQKQVAVGRVTETDTAQPLSVRRDVNLGQATETDEASAFTSSKTITVGAATETDLARPVGVTDPVWVPVVAVTETDLARPLGTAKTVTIAQVQEAGEATALITLQTILTGRATETDEAIPLVTGDRDLDIVYAGPAGAWEAASATGSWQGGPPGGSWTAGPPSR